MSYGFNIFNQTGTLAYSSESKCLNILDVFTISSDSTGSKTYPNYAGCTIQFQVTNAMVNPNWTINFQGFLPHNFTIDYALGYPRISWNYVGGLTPSGGYYYPPKVVYISLLSRPNISNYGIKFVNENNELLLVEDCANYKYLGQASVVSNDPAGGFWYIQSVMTASITSTTGYPLFFVENLNGQQTSIRNISQSGNVYTVTVSKSTNVAPRIFCFAKTENISLAGQYGMAIYNESGNLLFSSTNSVLNPLAYLTYSIPSTSISEPSSNYILPSTSLATVNGQIPTVSAIMCLANAFYGAEVNLFGTFVLKDCYLSFVRNSNSFYSGWLVGSGRGLPYDTTYPISANMSNLPKVFIIDANQYI